ncbi:MAG TPA: CAP domain-containing protein [Gaiellaceae bacterium]
MTPATAAAPVRLGFATLVAASVAASVVAVSADAAEGSWSSYLAPPAACPGADNPAAAPPAQRRAVGCLVNWARRQDRRVSLAQPVALQRAAALKGRGVASCGVLTHAPCGSDPTASLRASGYRYSSFGENLFIGAWGEVTPRDVVATWLQSPVHRANILRSGFRDLGAALVRGPGLFGDADAAVWVATFASPR